VCGGWSGEGGEEEGEEEEKGGGVLEGGIHQSGLIMFVLGSKVELNGQE